MQNTESYAADKIGSIPLVFGLLIHLDLSKQINTYYPSHKNWSGGDKGMIVVVWMCYLLTMNDHRLYEIENWFKLHEHSLNTLLKAYGYEALNEKDFTDDRLGSLLSSFGETQNWYLFLSSFTCNLLKLYDIQVRSIELDATIAQQYRSVIEDGLLQLGHSKQHRSDIPQFKSMMSNATEQNIPLMIQTVSGNKADDGLYLPIIEQTRTIVGQNGIMWQGDKKLSSFENRLGIAQHGDFYLTPASLVQISAATLQAYIKEHNDNEGIWTPLFVEKEVKKELQSIQIGTGFEFTVTLCHNDFSWSERRLIIHCSSYASAQQEAFDKKMTQTLDQLNGLNDKKQGKKAPKSTEELLNKANNIVEQKGLMPFLTLTVLTNTNTIEKRAYKAKEATTLQITTYTLQVTKNQQQIDTHIAHLGYQIYLTNQIQSELSLQQAIQSYRMEYKIERRIRNLKEEVCALLPIYLHKEDRIIGLVNLLTLLLQIVSVAEYRIAQSLKEENQRLAGLYTGLPKADTPKPTMAKILDAFDAIILICIFGNEQQPKNIIVNQTEITDKIVKLLKLPVNPYEMFRDYS